MSQNHDYLIAQHARLSDDVRYGLIHHSNDGDVTYCGQEINRHWWLTGNLNADDETKCTKECQTCVQLNPYYKDQTMNRGLLALASMEEVLNNLLIKDQGLTGEELDFAVRFNERLRQEADRLGVELP